MVDDGDRPLDPASFERLHPMRENHPHYLAENESVLSFSAPQRADHDSIDGAVTQCELVDGIDAMIRQARSFPEADLIVPAYERVRRGEITPLQAAKEIARARQRARRR